MHAAGFQKTKEVIEVEKKKKKEEEKEKKKEEEKERRKIYQKALDDLVNVNSLFTFAVFVGLAFASPNQHSLENRPECDADPGLAMRLVLFEVISFSCFLLSSLLAKMLKLYIHLDICGLKETSFATKVRQVILYISASASITGIVFLTLSMIDIIQIRVGKLSCGSQYTSRAVGSLCGIVLFALSIYVPSMTYAIWKFVIKPL